jgi:hypothetical protein
MKRLILIASLLLLGALNGVSQGVLNLNNIYAPTHIGSIDGPLAGSAIWAQFFAGTGADALGPVGAPVPHLDNGGAGTGFVFGGLITLPGVQEGQTAYVEMLAWDGMRWGALLSGVPRDQLGTTDTVPVVLGGLFGPPPPIPHFTQSAIVPVPEPSVLAMAITGGLGALLFRGFRMRLAGGSGRTPCRPEG